MALTTAANFKEYAGISVATYDTLIGNLITRATSAINTYCDRILESDVYRERLNGDGSETLFLSQWPITSVAYLCTGLEDVIKVQNTSSDAWNAYVDVSATDENSATATFYIQGGANDGNDALTLTTPYTTTTLAAAIVALGKGWSAEVMLSEYASYNSVDIIPVTGVRCLSTEYMYLQWPSEPEENFAVIGQTASPFKGNRGEVSLGTKFASGFQNVVVKYTAGYATVPADLEQVAIDVVKLWYDRRNQDSSLKSEKLGDYSYTLSEGDKAGLTLTSDVKRRLAKYKRW